MAIVLYNTLSKKKEEFKTLEEGKVKLYLCGPTVYDLLHIGNFRGPIFFNLMRNWLEFRDYKVTFVYNYTDIDDKIIKRANEEGVESSVISERYIEEFEKDFKQLKLRKHDFNPKVTENIPQIIDIVEKLIENKKAYVVDGEVFFEINNFKDYGKLSGKNIDDLNAGERVDVDQRKKNPFDFVLWKPSKENEPSWDSPWGKGRPGWHIECSAMIRNILGESIDIHGGGIDLIFPHHENEIAQGEGSCCSKYCTYWVHNNFLNMKNEKMSKSLGNVIKGRDFMNEYTPEVFKYMMLSTHYRSILNLTDEKIVHSIQGLERIYTALAHADFVIDFNSNDTGKIDKKFQEVLTAAEKKILTALDDDFNTGEALAGIYEVVRAFNSLNVLKKKKDHNIRAICLKFKEWLGSYGSMFSLFCESPLQMLEALDDVMLNKNSLTRSEIDELVEKRNKARSEKDFELSDSFRDELIAKGIMLLDGQDFGPKWTVKKA